MTENEFLLIERGVVAKGVENENRNTKKSGTLAIGVEKKLSIPLWVL